MNTDFYLQVMGYVFHIYPVHPMERCFTGYIQKPCKEAIEIHITEDDIEFERQMSEPLNSLPDTSYEKSAIHRAITNLLLKKDIFLFHGSALCKDEHAFIFTGVSGAGKSTHARLWRELYKDEIIMINDDKPYLTQKDQKIMVYGSPWNGKHQLGSDRSAPLKGIGLIHQADENKCIRISSKDAFLPLFTQTYRPESKEDLMKTIQFIQRITETVPVYDIYCTKEIEAAQISHDVMNGDI